MPYDRRTLLKYVAGTSVAGLTAACVEDGHNSPSPHWDCFGPHCNVSCPEGCDCSHLQSTVDGGAITLWHSRDQAGTELLRGTKNFWDRESEAALSASKIDSNYQGRLREDLAADKGPDLFLWAHDMIGDFQANGVLNDISDETRVERCMYTDKSWEAVSYRGGIYGLPYAAECPALLYNEDILDELEVDPPETLDEWKSIMDQWLEEGHDYALGHTVDPYYVTWAGHAYGSVAYDGDVLGLDTQAFADGLNIIFEDLKEYMPNDPKGEAQSAVFEDGTAPFLVDGPWTIANYGEVDRFDVGVVPIPDPDGGTARPYTGMQIVYTTAMPEEGSQDEAAARQFAEWYTTNDYRISNLVMNTGFVPTKRNFRTETAELPELVDGFAKQVEDGVLLPKNPDMHDVWGPCDDAVKEGFTDGGITLDRLETAAEQIRNQWNS